ncbi:MAG: serine/threonine protein kinase [Kofleriaceae bacterium]|nr:serine/threonine protein kinase [Kofleriaceae bacterium]
MPRDPDDPTRALDPRRRLDDDTHPVEPALDRPTVPAQPAAASPSPGTIDRGRYELRDLLGSGGMGDVWLARDRRIGREVAVKVARPEDDEDIARFLREARVQGQLDHPAVVPVHDVGTREDGAVYFTMKRVRGETLAQVIGRLAQGDEEARRRYGLRKLLTAFLSACHAVEVAHENGLVHRDLKPGNIMLGDHGEVYVLDWGLAKVRGEGASPSSRPSLPPALARGLTVAGQFLGTPGYMEPEQARGEAVDGRADVYALGATLFEMLTLEPLIPRGETREVLAATLAGADARASLRAPGVAPELEAVCVRATATAAAERYPTVAALREAIERFLDGDRDLQRRTALADGLADEAQAHAERAAAGDETARAAALAAVGRALALDPAHATAQATLVQLLVQPPRRTPVEVERAVEAAEDKTYTALAGAGAWIYILWLPIALVMVWMGVKRADPMLGWVGFTVAAAMTMMLARARGKALPGPYFAGLILSNIAIAITSQVAGTMILTPTLFTMNTVGFVVAARRAWLWPTVAVSAAAAVTPVLLETAGVVQRTTTIEGGAIHVRSQVVEFTEPQTSVAAVGVTIIFLVMVTVAAGRIRQRFLEQTRRAELAAWQLRQLVPRVER